MRILISLIFTLLPHWGYADWSCGLKGQVMPMSTENKDNVLVAQQVAMQASMIDMKSFCEWNRMGRVAKGTTGTVLEQYNMARAEGNKEEAANILAPTADTNHWKASISGHPLLKNKSRDSDLFSQYLPDGTTAKLSIDDLVTFAETGKLFSEGRPTFGVKPGREFEVDDTMEKERSLSSAEKLERSTQISSASKMGACAYIGRLTSISSCSKNLDEILKYATPSGGKEGGTTAYPSFKKVLTSKDYAPGLKRAFLKLHQQFKSRKVSGDLFSDIQSSFVESGNSLNEARDKAWEVMAVLSASGPNMGQRVWKSVYFNKNPNAAYLIGIAAMVPHLDTDAMMASPSRLYSLPHGVDFPCDSGKSYHFWMAAYLSRMLVKNGSSPQDATAASYISEIGYQTKSESAGRSPSSVSQWQRFGDTEIGVQIDLNLAAAGAHYGADQASKNLNKKVRYNLTENLRNSINNMGVSPTGGADSWKNRWLGSSVIWLDNFSPLSILKSYDSD